MATNFLEVHGMDVGGQRFDLGEPAFKAQVTHTAALKPLGFEAGKAMRDLSIFGSQCPTGRRSKIDGQYHHPVSRQR
jgi:hypothetical protein